MSISHISIVLGTRPEIIKLSPIVRELENRDGVEFDIIHTGQHYSENLDKVFFQELNIPTPDFHLDVGSGNPGEQSGYMLIEIEKVIRNINPDLVFVQGDTNSALAGSLAVSKHPIKLGHIEAGLRSFDHEMPEEINRKISDHISDLLFPPTDTSKHNLLNENIDPDRLHVVGNTIVDALYQNRPIANRKSKILNELSLGDDYVVLTAHRKSNVDNKDSLYNILSAVGEFAKKNDINVIYPIHPRSQKQIDKFSLSIPNEINIIDPLGYIDFLKLLSNSSLVVTDSGGIQEEACVLGVPCVTVRKNTERPETVEVNANKLAGTDPITILDSCEDMYNNQEKWNNPYGDGESAKKILNISLNSG